MQTNAAELIAELEKPINCDPANTICFANVLEARLSAATAGLRSIVVIDRQRQGIVTELENWLAIKQKVIENLQQIDKNSQTIDTKQSDSLSIMRDQLRDDKEKIGDLEQDLDACRGNQKWIGLGSAIAGGFVGYKIRGAGSIQNPFANFQNPFALSGVNFSQAPNSFIDFSSFQTLQEQRLRQALKSLQK